MYGKKQNETWDCVSGILRLAFLENNGSIATTASQCFSLQLEGEKGTFMPHEDFLESQQTIRFLILN